jgi:ubiquinone/menaquinone biosynthesis C-methylase UbiE
MKAGDTVLDACCGTGSQVFYYTRKGMIATGIDLNPGMIKLAEKNKGKAGLNNASFQVADAANLPFRDNLFDYVSISLSIHTNQRKGRGKIISEMKRVVKEEGSLIFVDFRVPLPKNVYAYLAQAIEFIAGHYKYFQSYIEHGGLDGIFKQNQLVEEKREYRKSNLMCMLKARSI